MIVPETHAQFRNTSRLIPSRYPAVGILDAIATADDLDAVIELESWTNDRVSAELGILHRVPREEWIVGRPMSTVVMAAFCHPTPNGGRFNGPDRGAWYACLALETAHAEVIHHRTAELAEVGVFETFVHVRVYHADLRGTFHDLRSEEPAFRRYYSKSKYEPAQKLARTLLEQGSNGIVYRSVRDTSGTCIACFRPKLVTNVRQGPHYEYRWNGTPDPKIRKL
jgi:hypothetical protein